MSSSRSSTVEELYDLIQKMDDPSILEVIKSLGLISARGKFDVEVSKSLQRWIKEGNGDRVVSIVNGQVSLAEEKEPESEPSEVSFGVFETHKAPAHPKTKKTLEKLEKLKVSKDAKETWMTVAELESCLDAKSLFFNEDNVEKVLSEYVKTLPATEESYLPGEIKIFNFGELGKPLNMNHLVGAGTKVLDAILFLSSIGDDDMMGLFEVTTLAKCEISSETLALRISMARKGIQACFALVYNQGGLPLIKDHDRVLSKFVKDTLFHGDIKNYGHLIEVLSCTSPGKFPGSLFLKMNLDLLPCAVASRCKMAIAGNRAIRYAALAKGFSRQTEISAGSAKKEDVAKAYEYNKKLETACQIVDFLAGLQSDFAAQILAHPLNPKKPITKNFTLKLTQAVLFSLSLEGRLSMREKIDTDDIGAFKRDVNLYGDEENGLIKWLILKNDDANFETLGLAGVKSAYGKP